ncbi:uncharacterized protein LOC106134944 isoform X1 [Amyelois transitella]|uniref:uncharacterized protein LOC106134944 isoform X1 n=2 Tax=Amyelois transitella TaxID=680683 RepID=UPI0029905108|nr:uncharacterized protein LOC106134944 isoform X1 [Amyelois transitella]
MAFELRFQVKLCTILQASFGTFFDVTTKQSARPLKKSLCLFEVKKIICIFIKTMSNSNVRNRRVSMRQLELLWEFLNSNKDIATGFNRSLQAKEYSARKWQEIAEILNAQGDGALKDGKMWSKYWVDYKAKLKKRNAALHSSRRRTGGGSANEPPLSQIEDKFLSILGVDFGQGMAGIRVDPLTEAHTAVTSEPTSQSILTREGMEEPSLVQLEVFDDGAGPSHEVDRHMDTEQAILEDPFPAVVEGERAEREEPELLAPSPQPSGRRSRSRSRSRHVLSREDARRLLEQSAQEKTEASVRSSNAMEGVHRSLALIANSLKTIQDDIRDIKSIMSSAFPRVAE